MSNSKLINTTVWCREGNIQKVFNEIKIALDTQKIPVKGD